MVIELDELGALGHILEAELKTGDGTRERKELNTAHGLYSEELSELFSGVMGRLETGQIWWVAKPNSSVGRGHFQVLLKHSNGCVKLVIAVW